MTSTPRGFDRYPGSILGESPGLMEVLEFSQISCGESSHYDSIRCEHSGIKESSRIIHREAIEKSLTYGHFRGKAVGRAVLQS